MAMPYDIQLRGGVSEITESHGSHRTTEESVGFRENLNLRSCNPAAYISFVLWMS